MASVPRESKAVPGADVNVEDLDFEKLFDEVDAVADVDEVKGELGDADDADTEGDSGVTSRSNGIKSVPNDMINVRVTNLAGEIVFDQLRPRNSLYVHKGGGKDGKDEMLIFDIGHVLLKLADKIGVPLQFLALYKEGNGEMDITQKLPVELPNEPEINLHVVVADVTSAYLRV